MQKRITLTKLVNRFWHLGIIYPSCSEQWYIILWMIFTEIERRHYPQWMPVFIMKILAKFKWYQPVFITQVKEKFAQLRIYDCDNDLYDYAIAMSEITCEDCGDTNAKIIERHKWLSTLCDKCNKIDRKR
jgi:ribosomal protein S27E